jgi:hypothetical protein
MNNLKLVPQSEMGKRALSGPVGAPQRGQEEAIDLEMVTRLAKHGICLLPFQLVADEFDVLILRQWK